MKIFSMMFAIVFVAPAVVSAEPARIEVYLSPTCGCCMKWVRHLEAEGFSVSVNDVRDVRPIKAAQGVPSSPRSCHTALVDGYVVEGHVPANDVKRLLAERPKVAGLAVPGMPVGAPGMEGPNRERYRVMSFDAAGGIETFSSQEP